VERNFTGAFVANIRHMHVKDSNKYEICIIFKSINVLTGTGNFMKKLMGGVTEMRV
jgi:hypothetical protein